MVRELRMLPKSVMLGGEEYKLMSISNYDLKGAEGSKCKIKLIKKW